MELSELLGVDKVAVPLPGAMLGSKARNTALASARQEAESSSHMVSILTGQRDRYKEKLGIVEVNLQTMQHQLSTINSAKQRLETDNMELYGKLRFLQSRGGSSNGGGGNRVGGNFSPAPGMRISVAHKQNHHDIEEGEEDVDVEDRYSALYEQKHNPFNEFASIEKSRRLSEMTVTDRVVFSSLSTFINTQQGRTALLVYLGIMHFFTFVAIYTMTHHTASVGCNPDIDHHIAHQVSKSYS